MTDGLDLAFRNAGIALLQADASLVVYPGKVPSGGTPPYVLVYPNVRWIAEDPDNPVTGLSRALEAQWICHCVGAGEDDTAALAVAQRVRTQLLDARPVVAGLSCGLIKQDTPDPPRRDESTGSLVMDAVVTYRCKATAN